MSSLGIVGDDLPGAAPVPDVELVENGISVLCRSDTIFLHERLCCLLAEYIGKKGDKSVLWREKQRFPDNFHREQTRCITESHNVHKFTLDVTYVQKGVQLVTKV